MAVLGLHCIGCAFSSCGLWASHRGGFSLRHGLQSASSIVVVLGLQALRHAGPSWTRD